MTLMYYSHWIQTGDKSLADLCDSNAQPAETLKRAS